MGADAPNHAVRDRAEVPVIELDEEHRLCRRRNPERLAVEEGERAAVDGFDRTRARCDDFGDGRAEVLEAIEVQEERDPRPGGWAGAHRHLRDRPEGPFAPHKTARPSATPAGHRLTGAAHIV